MVEAGLRCLQWNRNSSPRTGLSSITLPTVPTGVDKPGPRPGAVTGPESRDRMVRSPLLCRLPLRLRDPEVQPSGPSGHGVSWGWKGGPGSCCENALGPGSGGTCHRGHLPGRLQLPPALLSQARPYLAQIKHIPGARREPCREERGEREKPGSLGPDSSLFPGPSRKRRALTPWGCGLRSFLPASLWATPPCAPRANSSAELSDIPRVPLSEPGMAEIKSSPVQETFPG